MKFDQTGERAVPCPTVYCRLGRVILMYRRKNWTPEETPACWPHKSHKDRAVSVYHVLSLNGVCGFPHRRLIQAVWMLANPLVPKPLTLWVWDFYFKLLRQELQHIV